MKQLQRVLMPGAVPRMWRAALMTRPVVLKAPLTQPSARPLRTIMSPKKTLSRTALAASSSVIPLALRRA